MSAPVFDPAHYAALWQRMTILPDRVAAVQSVAHKIILYKDRYRKLELTTGIPWWFIGIIHYRESDCNFHCHLHNGDPLTKRTVQVPVGRPLGEPPFGWEESALDALEYEGFLKVKDWTLESAAYRWEAYNGWGYWHLGVTSAYLLAGTNEHAKGKYTSDHHYDPEAKDQELGCLPLLQGIMQLDPSVSVKNSPQSSPVVSPKAPPVTQPAVLPPAPAPVPVAKTGWAVVIGTLTSLSTAVGQAFDSLKPLLSHPAVVAVLVSVALVAGGVILWEHMKRHA